MEAATMAGKKIVFETVAVAGDYNYGTGQKPEVNLHVSGNCIAVNATHVAVGYSDPAKLDALADACRRAAEALRKSQRLTFGDLEVGEWFRWAEHAKDDRWAVRKMGDLTIINPENYRHPHNEPEVYLAPTVRDSLVVRVTATFTPVATEGR
jgi:hypothetical protein